MINKYKNKLRELLGEDARIGVELIAGLTVALALVPEAVAFSFVAGVDPLVGLYAAFIVGLITSIFGGRPGMISGATGALAVVMAELVFHHGVDYLFASLLLMGLIQILVGIFKLGKFSKMIPETVMLGFVNGLAIVIGKAQFASFAGLVGMELLIMIGLVIGTMIIIYFAPKVNKNIPGALVAIVVLSSLVIALSIDTVTVGDLASVKGGLPKFSIPNVPFNLETLEIIWPYSLIFAAVGLIESLMTLRLVDEKTDTKGNPNRESIGQGLANVVCGLFGAMGGCAMIGQTMINYDNGARKRLSGISAALFLLSFIMFGSSIIELIPIGVLTGIMFMVVIGTFEWMSFKIIRRIPKSDAFIIIFVTAVTVLFDLAIAVGLGIVISSVVFSWKKGDNILVSIENDTPEQKEYSLWGALFFGSVMTFTDHFDAANDPEYTTIDFAHARIFDYSGVEALNMLTEKYNQAGKKLVIKNLNHACVEMIEKSSILVCINII